MPTPCPVTGADACKFFGCAGGVCYLRTRGYPERKMNKPDADPAVLRVSRRSYLTTLCRIERELEGLRPAAGILGELPLASLAQAIHHVRLAAADAN